MEFVVELSRRAENDVEGAYRYIAKDSPQNALSWRRGLEDKLRSLSTLPERCSVAPESYYARVDVRQAIYGQYRLLFTIEGQLVYVLTVRHGARRRLSKAAMDRLL